MKTPCLRGAMLLVLCGCASPASQDSEALTLNNEADALVDNPLVFQQDFRRWLTAHVASSSELLRPDLGVSPGFGGCADGRRKTTRTPIVFIHGNGDSAIGSSAPGSLGRGWRSTAEALLRAGYSPCDMYAFTWGTANANSASLQAHDRVALGRVRLAIEAVLHYTGADKVDVVGHSMGVTLARGAILGGAFTDAKGRFDLGAPLGARVRRFLGIAGANRGLASCWSAAWLPTCSRSNGLFPGTWNAYDRSEFLRILDSRSGSLGEKVASAASDADTLLGIGGGWVYGKGTAHVPEESMHCAPAGRGHLQLRDDAQLFLSEFDGPRVHCTSRASGM